MTALEPLPRRDGAIPLGRLIDLYMGQYTGRDTARVYRLEGID